MYRTNRRIIAPAIPLSGLPVFGPPRGGWRRDNPGDGGDGNHGGSAVAGDGGQQNDDGKDGDGKKPDIKGDFDPDRAARTIAAARAAEKKAKDEAAAAKARTEAILKAAGLTPDGKTDPAEQLKAALAERDTAVTAARQTAVELTVYRTAGKAGGDPDALLDSRAFFAAVAELDPAAADFADKIADAVKAAVKANPKLAALTQAGQGPAKQGADITGGGSAKTRPAGLGAAIAARMQRT